MTDDTVTKNLPDLMTNTKTDPTTIPGATVLVMVPHYWGKGDSVADAKKVVRAESGRLPTKKDGYLVYQFAPDAGIEFSHVDGMGGVWWDYTTDQARADKVQPGRWHVKS